ncbi:MAG: MBL fold metallo-hydrolase [Xanthobacteraceae bacterium]
MKKIWPFLIAGFAVFLIGSRYESAAQTNTAPPKAETRLITLGTVAAGDGVARRIAKAGFNVRDVGAVFITHHHDDHTAGLGTLM